MAGITCDSFFFFFQGCLQQTSECDKDGSGDLLPVRLLCKSSREDRSFSPLTKHPFTWAGRDMHTQSGGRGETENSEEAAQGITSYKTVDNSPGQQLYLRLLTKAILDKPIQV